MDLGVEADPAEQRVILDGISWTEFRELARKRDAAERRSLRFHYLEGALELMSVGGPHELMKTMLGRLLERWSEVAGVDLNGVGQQTIMNRRRRSAAEPDESYHLGRYKSGPADLAIEVIITHGGLDKLEIYRKLGVREVWIWLDDALNVFTFERDAWHRRRRSKLLPDCDLELIERCARVGDQPKAIRKLLRALKQ